MKYQIYNHAVKDLISQLCAMCIQYASASMFIIILIHVLFAPWSCRNHFYTHMLRMYIQTYSMSIQYEIFCANNISFQLRLLVLAFTLESVESQPSAQQIRCGGTDSLMSVAHWRPWSRVDNPFHLRSATYVSQQLVETVRPIQ